MAVGLLDQQQTTSTSQFGFGEFANVRYRGQKFTPAIRGKLATLGFNRIKQSVGVKVYIDTVSGGVPAHAVGSELYSWEITNAALVNGYGEYDLPVPLYLNKGTEYCFYVAPWNTSTHAYVDDYRDAAGRTQTGGGEITNTNGTWSTENLDWHFKTYIVPEDALFINPTIG